MTKDEINKKQEETLNNLKKYNKTRKTEVVDDIEGNPTVVTQWTDANETLVDAEAAKPAAPRIHLLRGPGP